MLIYPFLKTGKRRGASTSWKSSYSIRYVYAPSPCTGQKMVNLSLLPLDIKLILICRENERRYTFEVVLEERYAGVILHIC